MNYSKLNFFRFAVMLGLGLALGPQRALAQKPLGLDVSGYQGSYQSTPTHVTWSSVKAAGYVFSWARATEGINIVDPDFTYNAVNGKAAGIYMGAYHFARPDLNTPASDASAFWSVAGSYIKNDGLTLMPMLDFETFSGYTGASSYSDWANQWCADVVSYGAAAGISLKPFIYLSACKGSYFNSSISQWTSDIANYGSVNGDNDPQNGTPWSSCADDDVWGSSTWTMWQYESIGTVSGINGNVDHDVFNGTSAQLLSYVVGGGNPSAPPGATVYWDPSAKKASPGSGGTGNWDTSTADWWYTGSSNWVWSAGGNNAIFAGTSAGTVTLKSSLSAGGLIFSNAGYNITGTANTLNLTNPANIVVPLPASTPTYIQCVLSGTGYNVSGGGVLVLNNPANSSTGAITVGTSTTLVLTTSLALGDGVGTVTLSGGGSLQNNDTNTGDTFLNSSYSIILGAGGGNLNANINAVLNYSGIIGGTGNLTKIGGGGGTGGTLILNGTNSYTGITTISQGVLALGSTGSINNSSQINILPGGTFDVSAYPAWSLGTQFHASGTGNTIGTTAASLKGASGGTLSFGIHPLTLIFSPTVTTGDVTHPALYISQGTLILSSGNTITISNTLGAALGVGSYRVIQQASGNISNSPYPTPFYSSGVPGAAPGTTSILATSGTSVYLNILYTTTNTLSPLSPAIYGHSVTFTSTITPTPPNSMVQFYDSGVALGSAVPLSGGVATYTTSTLAVGNHSITAGYMGNSTYAGSTNSAQTQQITKAPLGITAIAQSKVYGTTLATGSGNTNFSSSGLQNGNTVGSVTLTVNSNGAAASAPVGNYTITPSAATGGTFSAANYTITYTNGPLSVTLPPNTTPVTVTGISMTSGGGAQMSFTGTPGYIYLIESATNILPPITWTTLGTNAADSNGNFNFTDTNAPSYGYQFYRTATQ